MASIVELRTLYCGSNGSDKVYGIAIVHDGSLYRLITFYGPRGKTLNERKEMSGTSMNGMSPKLREIEKTRRKHGYTPVDWQDRKWGMYDHVLSLGTPPGFKPAPVETKPVAPKKQQILTGVMRAIDPRFWI